MNNSGFAVIENVLTSDECDLLATAISPSSACAGVRNLMSHPLVASIANDPRLLDLAASALGHTAIPFRATLFDKSSISNWQVLWHQDRALPLTNHVSSNEWGPWSTKGGVLYALAPAWALQRVVALRIHLDVSTNENGPLRVVPTSHKAGVLSSDEINRVVNTGPVETCKIGRGGILMMRPLVVHSSQKTRDRARRRVIHIEYADTINFGNEVRLRIA